MTARRPTALLLAALLACPLASAAAQGGTLTRAERSRFRDAAEYSREHGGRAVLVVRGDSVVFEAYHDGYSAERPHGLASGTKSFTCAIAAAAVEDGLLSSLDEPVSATLPEMGGTPERARVTVRHLLSLTSGLDPLNQAAGPDPTDHYASALLVPMRAPPGERWAYGDTQFDVFGALMERKLAPLGEDPLRYLERRVLEPIGVRGHVWSRDRAGNPLFAGGAGMTARDWSRFGRLVRDGGRWEGRQVIREDLLRECFRGSAAQPEYGLAFWLNAETPAGRTRGIPDADMVAAIGYGNQNLFVLPSRNLVVVRLGRPDAAYRTAEFLARLLGEPLPARRPAAGREP